MEPLDDYAIKILRDKRGLIETIIHPKNTDDKLYVFDNVDKKKLRNFFASLMWRVSVSKQLELRKLSIGKFYEDKIRHDLLHDGDADYIDVFVSFLTDPMHNAFFLPERKRFGPLDLKRDSQNINGWIIQFPNIHVLLSLDKRRLPNRIYATISENKMPISTSIHPDSDAYNFVVIERKNNKTQLKQIVDSFIKSNRLEKNTLIGRNL